MGILDFTLFGEDKEFYSCSHLGEDGRRRKYTDKLEIHILKLPKWNLVSQQKQTESQRADLQNLARFPHAESKEELDLAASTNSYLVKAYTLVG